MVEIRRQTLGYTTRQSACLRGKPRFGGEETSKASAPKAPGQLYDRFEQTPAGALLAYLDKSEQRPAIPAIQLQYQLQDVQARYGLHLNGATLIEMGLDPVSRALAKPAIRQAVKFALQQPEVQERLRYFHPKAQLEALDALVEDPKAFTAFTKDPIFNAFLQTARHQEPFKTMLYEGEGNQAPLVNRFRELYAMFGPSKRHQDRRPSRSEGEWSPQLSTIFYTHAVNSSPVMAMMGSIKSPGTRMRIFQLAGSEDNGNRIQFEAAYNRFAHRGGKQVVDFLNFVDPSGRKASDVMDAMLPYRHFGGAAGIGYHRALDRFLTLASQWVLTNPDVADAQKTADILALKNALPSRPLFKAQWDTIQERYPLFPELSRPSQLKEKKPMSTQTVTLAPADQQFVDDVKTAFSASNTDFARSYYLFATARLEETYNSSAIYEKYPVLHDENTFKRIKSLYDQHPENEEIKRLFNDTLGTHIGSKLSKESDELTNKKNGLRIDLKGLDIKDKSGKVLDSILYEDTSELFKVIPEKEKRETLYQRINEAYNRDITPMFIELFRKENQILADLGYPQIIDFYSRSSGHNLRKLGENGAKLVRETVDDYTPRMSQFYTERTGKPFTEATRADIAFVLNGKSPDMEAIDQKFPESRLVELARKTFDGLGLAFSTVAETVDFGSKEAYQKAVDDPNRPSRILLDIANREGKRSRAYVYPAKVPGEIYLSVKPEGGLDDYSAFFHESGHALHFANEDKSLSFPLALMGNNTTTESYAYLFQNLFLNKHWLVKQAGLSADEAGKAIRRSALNDLYMLRRYASKMQFELKLYDNISTLNGVPEAYSSLLTEGTGFKYDGAGWTRDVDSGFYVADYFTAWTLEAQLREYLQNHFGNAENTGEDWYQNPKAGEFLKTLWKDGNITQADLSKRLGYNDPTDVGPLLRLMKQNLSR